MEVVGDGTNIWPMVHVEDLARAYVAAAEHAPPGRSYNIVDDSEDSWLDLLHHAGRLEVGVPVIVGVPRSVAASDDLPR